jgi:curli production assembly/transport component CsgG
MKLVCSCSVCLLLVLPASVAQEKPVRVGVLPFESKAGGVTAFDQQLASQLSRNNSLSSRLVKTPAGGFLDRDTLIQLGKKLDVQYLIQGRILSVSRSSDNRTLPLPRLGRIQTASQTGEVSVEADLIAVSTGKILATCKSVGKATVRSTETTVATRHGSHTVGDGRSGQDPVSQAARDAAEKLARNVPRALRL